MNSDLLLLILAALVSTSISLILRRALRKTNDHRDSDHPG